MTYKNTYNHAYSVAFSVSGSQYEDSDMTVRHEKDKVIAALLARVAELLRDNAEYTEALDCFDSYEETHLKVATVAFK